MANTILQSEVHGTHLHESQRGTVVVDALNRIGTPAADSTLFFDGSTWTAFVGTWTAALGANGVPETTKSAAAQVGHVIRSVNQQTREAAERGLLLVSADLFYSIATAALTELQLLLTDYDGSVLEGSEPSRTIVAGNSDAHYDENHNTAAERGAIAAAEKLTVTVPTPAAFLAGFHSANLEVLATDPGTSVFTLHGATLRFQHVDADIKSPT
jgi:hypothetical protein